MGKVEGTWKKIVKITKSLQNSWIVDVHAGEEYGTIFAGRVGVDDRKLFAFVIPLGDEQGVHLRSVDPEVTSDSARFAPSRVFLVTRSNWVRLLPQGKALCRGSADMVWKNTVRAAEHAVHALQEKGDPAAVREFIRLLDDWILVAEIVGLDRMLWRASNEKGLRHKVGPRYRWITGSRDDVLASVPDVSFERAVASALEREASR
jgi:hypothetical protein